MSEEKKGVKELRVELNKARMEERRANNSNVTVSKNFAVGIPQKTEEKRVAPKEVPNVGVNPRKKKGNRENIPFY